MRFYITPVETLNTGDGFLWVPKYFESGTIRNRPGVIVTSPVWDGRRYGDQKAFVVAADVPDSQHATLLAQPDVTAFADDLDAPLGNRLQEMRTQMEALNIPAQTLTGQSTHRTALRGVLGMMAVAQNMSGRGYDIFAPGINFNTTMAQLPADAYSALDASLRKVGFAAIADTLTPASTVRDVLQGVAAVPSPIVMSGVTI